MLIDEAGRPAFEPVAMETPCIVVDKAALQANVARAQWIADAGGCALRPHIKTHKSLSIARMQLDAGARGVTAAKSEEALVFVRAGVPSLTVAYPILDPAKLSRLMVAKAEYGTDLRFIADSVEAAQALADAARSGGQRVGVYLKVDVGLGRIGVRPEDSGAIDVAAAMARMRDVDFLGLLSHAGHAYGANGPEGVAAIAESERAQMIEFAARLRREGIEVPEISVGSTPTVLGRQSLEGITEIRPGNYVFLDLTAVRLGVCRISDLALGVVATVVGAGGSHVIIDAGSKVLSSDLGAHGMASERRYGLAFPFGTQSRGFPVERLSEEHGFVSAEIGAKPGERLLILPNHACPLPNLVGTMTLLDGDGTTTRLEVEAASCVL